MLATSDAIRVRPGTLADLRCLEQVEWEAAALFPASALPPNPEPVSKEAFVHGLSHALLWVAASPIDAVVGFLLARRESDCLHIVEMDVLPRYGRRGIGTRLLQEACKRAAPPAFRFVTLTTFEHLAWNAPFYARHGFSRLTDPRAFPHVALALQGESERGLERRVGMVRVAAWRAFDRPRGNA